MLSIAPKGPEGGPPQPAPAAPAAPAAAAAAEDNRKASRRSASAVPAITGLRISPHGVEATLVNISESGVLAECGERLKPGSSVTVVFEGSFSPRTMEGRVARNSVSSMGADGRLRYHVGIAFARPIALPPEESAAPAPAQAPPAPAAPQPVAAAAPVQAVVATASVAPAPAPAPSTAASPVAAAAPRIAPAPVAPAPNEIVVPIEFPQAVRNRW